MGNRKLYVGTYTRPAPYLAETNGNGLYVLDYDEDSAEFSMVQELPGIENPSYLCVSGDGRNLYAIWEVFGWPEGLVSSYGVDPSTGELSYSGVQGSRGALACYVVTDSQSRAAFVANYLSATVAMFPIRPDGSLAEASSVGQHEGTGPNKEHQEGPRAHCIVLDPAEVFAFSADLGTDTIFGYRIDYDAAGLVPHSRLELPPGRGPRHLVFAPDGRHAFVIGELDSTITALGYDAGGGILALIASYSSLPEGFDGFSIGADIQVHPSGRFVYGSNRGHDSIVMFAIDQETGRLRLLGHRSTEGATPRNIAISPDGRFLLVANQDSDNIVTMPVDLTTGALGATSSVVEVPTPACLKFGV